MRAQHHSRCSVLLMVLFQVNRNDDVLCYIVMVLRVFAEGGVIVFLQQTV